MTVIIFSEFFITTDADELHGIRLVVGEDGEDEFTVTAVCVDTAGTAFTKVLRWAANRVAIWFAI